MFVSLRSNVAYLTSNGMVVWNEHLEKSMNSSLMGLVSL